MNADKKCDRRAKSLPTTGALVAELRQDPGWKDVKVYREWLDEKQQTFWNRFGVTQCTGSRYEASRRPLPMPLEMLMVAFYMGLLSDECLERLRQVVLQQNP
jgi:hypothetical protein